MLATRNAASQIPAPAPTAQPELHSVLSRLDHLIERSGMVADRLERVNARAFGSPPKNAEGSAVSAVPSGTLAAINEKLDAITLHLAQGEEQIDRLDTLV